MKEFIFNPVVFLGLCAIVLLAVAWCALLIEHIHGKLVNKKLPKPIKKGDLVICSLGVMVIRCRVYKAHENHFTDKNGNYYFYAAFRKMTTKEKFNYYFNIK